MTIKKTSQSTTDKTGLAAVAAGILPGLKKHFPNGAQTLTFAGGTVTATVDQTVTKVQTLVDLHAGVTTARSNLAAAIAAENGQLAPLRGFLRALEAFIRLTFGADVTALADFGLTPPKARAPRTAEQKAVAQAKAAATRKARKAAQAQASAAQGNVTATLVVTPATPAATPATPVPVATPVAPAPAPAPVKA